MALFSSNGGRYDRPLRLTAPRLPYSEYLARNRLRTSTNPDTPARSDPPSGETPRMIVPARYEENGVTKFSYHLSAPEGNSSSEEPVLWVIKGRPNRGREGMAATAPPATCTTTRRGKNAVKWSSMSSTESRPVKSALKASKTKKSESDLSNVTREIHSRNPWLNRNRAKTVTFAPRAKKAEDAISPDRMVTPRQLECRSPPANVSPPGPWKTEDDDQADITTYENKIDRCHSFSAYLGVDPKVRMYLASPLHGSRESLSYDKNESERKLNAIAEFYKSDKFSYYTSMRSAEILKTKTSNSNAIETKPGPSTSSQKKSGDVVVASKGKKSKYYNPKYAKVKAKVSTTWNQAELKAESSSTRGARGPPS